MRTNQKQPISFFKSIFISDPSSNHQLKLNAVRVWHLIFTGFAIVVTGQQLRLSVHVHRQYKKSVVSGK